MRRVTMKRKQHKSSYPVHIPNDIMMQVLPRLPVKSLMRFKCVCKLWQTIISDPEFCQLHQTLSETRSDGKYFVTFWYYPYRDRIFISFKNFNRSRVARPIELKIRNYECQYISASEPLDGLVCLYTSQPNNHALVLNLSTRQIVHLPKNDFSQICFPKYFLGFDPVSGDYKVLKFYRHYWKHRKTSCKIYTLGTPSWRKLKKSPRGILKSTSSGPCVNGTIYWMRFKKNNSSLIAFDVGEEVFRTIKLKLSGPEYSGKLFAVGGQSVTLLVPRWIGVRGENSIGFSFLKEIDKNEILVKENIDFPANLEKTVGLRMSGVSPTGEIVLVDDLRSRNVYYHLRKKTWREDWFVWSRPMENDPSDPRPSLNRRFRYICVDNIVRLKDHDSVRNPDHSFLIE